MIGVDVGISGGNFVVSVGPRSFLGSELDLFTLMTNLNVWAGILLCWMVCSVHYHVFVNSSD